MSNKPGSITILQLTRFGDLLQTYWAVKEVKKVNPQMKVNLIGRKRFVSPLLFLLKTVFDNILSLDPLDLTTDDKTEGIDRQLERINAFETDVLVNLSFSNSSAYLSNLIDAKFKLGLVANSNGGVAPSGAWSEYVYSTVMRGPLNPFSIIDIFKFILGVELKPSFKDKTVSSNKMIVHPFASQERKAWNISKWSEVLFKVLKNNPDVEISVVGGEGDLEKANILKNNPVLEAFKDRLHIKCGTLSLEQLHRELDQAFLFCGHDSMVGNMASTTNTQTLTISLGSARAAETTPYGPNNYSLSPKTQCYPCFPTDACSEYKCHKDLSYTLVGEVLQQLIDTREVAIEDLRKNISPIHLSTANIYKSSFSPSGLFQLENLLQGQESYEDCIRSFYKIIWLFMLEGIEESSSYPKLSNLGKEQLEGLVPNLKQLFELAEFGKKYSRFILDEASKESPDVEYIKSCGQKIQEIDEMQELMVKASPALGPIVDFFNLKKANMVGGNLVELCASSYDIYQGIGSFCDIFYELAEKTLKEFKIVNKKESVQEAKE